MGNGRRWTGLVRRAVCATAGAVVLAGAAGLAQERAPLPQNLTCSGNEPSWKLEIASATATWSDAAPGAEERRYRGSVVQVPTAAPPMVVWRGRLDAGLRELVAMISQETCKDSMSSEGPAKGEFPFSARVSLPQGEVRTGCCRPVGPDAGWAPPAVVRAAIGRVTGTVAYRARIALAPDAVLKVALVESGAEPVTVSEVSLSRPGQVPIPFELPYATARINPRRTYTVRATIEQGGEVKWTSTRSYPVINNDRFAEVDVIVEMVKPAQ